MKKVLLTGATGFIGRQAISLLLKRGYQVCAIYNHKALFAGNDKNLQWYKCDLFDFVQQKQLFDDIKPTHLLHFAWYVEPPEYRNSFKNIKWVQCSLELIANFVRTGGQRAVVAGSCAEYDWSYGYCIEGVTPTRPLSLYGACKQNLGDIYLSLCQQAGVSGAWGRIFFLYGPYEHPLRMVPSVICSLIRGETANCSHGEQLRDFMYVIDVADAFAALLDSNVIGAVNIASGAPIAVKEIIYKIADLLGKDKLIQLGAIPVAPSDPYVLIGDKRRLINEVGWLPKHSLDAGLAETIVWWKNHRGVN